MGLGPVGAQGAQQQAGQDPLAVLQVGQGADDGDEGVGAGVQQVVVPEGAQRHVLRAGGTEGQAPGLFAPVDEDGVLVHGHLLDAGLGVVGGQLAPDHLPVQAAGQQGNAVGGAGQLQGEGFGDGDGLEQVLDAQHGALAGAGRRHRQQHRGAGLAVAQEDFPGVQLQIHIFLPFAVYEIGCWYRFCPPLMARAGPPLDYLGLLRGGLDADGKAVAPRQQ